MPRHCLPNSRMKDAFKVGGIREIVNRAESLQREGKKIIHLEIGRPDYDSPLCAKKAAIDALEKGQVHYTDMTGSPSLRRAIAYAVKRDQGLDIDPDNQIIVTIGAIEALSALLLAVLEPGDEVIVPAPFFPAYPIQIALAGGIVKTVACKFDNSFKPRIQDLKAAVTPKTKILLLNSPNNPTGAVFTRNELQEIAQLADEQDLLVVSDECYEKFLYEGEHISIASLPGMEKRTVVISAASKTFSMTGWRIGWLILPSEMKPYVAKCHQHLSTCATSFAQEGVAEALLNAGEDVQKMITGYRERRDFFTQQLKAIDGFDLHTPQGAFYAFPFVGRLTKALNMNAIELATWLLEEAGVATVPGDAFGADGDFLRMAYCRPISELKEALESVRIAVLGRLKGI